MRIPTLLSRTGLAAAATCLALAAAPVQAQGMMNLLNSLGGSGNSGSGAAGLLGAVVRTKSFKEEEAAPPTTAPRART